LRAAGRSSSGLCVSNFESRYFLQKIFASAEAVEIFNTP
jgi:hypothetical protein